MKLDFGDPQIVFKMFLYYYNSNYNYNPQIQISNLSSLPLNTMLISYLNPNFHCFLLKYANFQPSQYMCKL